MLLLASADAYASDEPEIWNTSTTRVWLDDHLAAARRVIRSRPSYRLTRTQIWANGIARSSTSAFVPNDFDRSIGAKLQPFHDLNFLVGTELIRSAGEASLLSSKAVWEAYWSRDWKDLDGFRIGLTTSGSVDNIQSNYFQSLSGSLDIPLDFPLVSWRTGLRLSPSMSFDALNGAISTALTSEILGQRQLSSRASPFKSVLNIKVGYGVAPDTRPTASARLEIMISPNL